MRDKSTTVVVVIACVGTYCYRYHYYVKFAGDKMMQEFRTSDVSCRSQNVSLLNAIMYTAHRRTGNFFVCNIIKSYIIYLQISYK